MSKIEFSCIIDDDPISVYGIKRSMKMIDFSKTIVVYKNGQEAIEGVNAMVTAGERIPSIMFLDLNMPIMDGWEFLDHFIKIPNSKTDYVAIYIISSSINSEDMIRAKSYKIVNNYIVKPVGSQDLVKLLTD
ncbi:Regulator of RpoS [Arenibacter antarcticus]|uniref:Response regulator n=1 Tax=Arenibacter antarcticus TaxID=2040469 RepID=A0ABW5VKS9_9FLAO|nr:response regulator [Arenibacter sp. H213]MCM4166727.1 response regulator [Arenibacter sp. H213]